MSVVGLALYGSHARGDPRPGADVDLLAVTTDDDAAADVRAQLAIASYPLDRIVRHAARGDLFVLHIVSEAKVLYEAWAVFDAIARAFVYKADYAREIRLASDVGWFLARHAHRFRDGQRFNERVSWCVRTVLIARAAAMRTPVFSAARLAEFSGCDAVRALIDHRRRATVDSSLVGRFAEFLRDFGAAEPVVRASLDEQRCAFEADRNAAGLSAVGQLTGELRRAAGR
jgi:predicted nucleotidyltransferase